MSAEPPITTGKCGETIPEQLATVPLLHDLDEVGRLLGGLCRRTVQSLIAENKLPSVKIGTRRMVRHADLVTFVAGLPTGHTKRSQS